MTAGPLAPILHHIHLLADVDEARTLSDGQLLARFAAQRDEASFGVPRAPAVEYGVQAPTHPFPGGAALRRKTLHRVMNELIESWEVGAGVKEFVILTAQAVDAHLEALSTIRTETASTLACGYYSESRDRSRSSRSASIRSDFVTTIRSASSSCFR